MTADKKLFESYDDYALKWARRIRGGKFIAHKFLEKPAMNKKLPDLKNKTVLCVGRGSGEECRHLKEPRPLKSVREKKPDFYSIHSKIPLFMIFELRKKSPPNR